MVHTKHETENQSSYTVSFTANQKTEKKIPQKSVLGLTVFYFPFNVFRSAQKCEITN